ncbi:MAG: YicC/YloC family endoribonuclease [Bacteroidales bacterium]
MMKSMTGFGKTELQVNNKKISIEIKTLNSKQIDISTRVPVIYKEKELELRKLLSQKLLRGKIELSIYIERTGESSNFTFNKALAKSYYEELKDLSEDIHQQNFNNYLPIIIKLPDVMKPEIEKLNPEEWKNIESSAIAAIASVDKFRMEEGKVLENDFNERIQTIKDLLKLVEPHEKERINTLRVRIQKNLSEIIEENKFDKNRFEQELLYYIEKLDITEEKVRLTNHCEYFIATMKELDSPGKKLSFISQEIGREINTLGSKANNAEIQKIVVQMKDELEKIKEQLFNIL